MRYDSSQPQHRRRNRGMTPQHESFGDIDADIEDLSCDRRKRKRPAVGGLGLLLEAPAAFTGAEAPMGLYAGGAGPFVEAIPDWPCPCPEGADVEGAGEVDALAADESGAGLLAVLLLSA